MEEKALEGRTPREYPAVLQDLPGTPSRDQSLGEAPTPRWKRRGEPQEGQAPGKPAPTSDGGKTLKGGDRAAAAGESPRPGRVAGRRMRTAEDGRRSDPHAHGASEAARSMHRTPRTSGEPSRGSHPARRPTMKTRKTGFQGRSRPSGQRTRKRLGASAAPPFAAPPVSIGEAHGPKQPGRAGMQAPRAQNASRATAPSERLGPSRRPTRSDRGGATPGEVVSMSQSSGEVRSFSCSTPFFSPAP